jgi:hypothetical protein
MLFLVQRNLHQKRSECNIFMSTENSMYTPIIEHSIDDIFDFIPKKETNHLKSLSKMAENLRWYSRQASPVAGPEKPAWTYTTCPSQLVIMVVG